MDSEKTGEKTGEKIREETGEETREEAGAGKSKTPSRRKVIVRELVAWIRRHDLTYTQISDYFREARKAIGMVPVKRRGRKLPKVLRDDEIDRIMKEAEKSLHPRDRLLIRLLFFCALRVEETCKLLIEDIDFTNYEISIRGGKGDKDRTVPFPRSMVPEIRNYLELLRRDRPRATYLFTSARYNKPITRARAWQIVQALGVRAEVGNLHPHRFRHSMITWLTRQGLSDERLMRIAGHADKKTLQVYQDLQTSDLKEDYEEAVAKLKF